MISMDWPCFQDCKWQDIDQAELTSNRLSKPSEDEVAPHQRNFSNPKWAEPKTLFLFFQQYRPKQKAENAQPHVANG